MTLSRRTFLKSTGAAALTAAGLGALPAAAAREYGVSLAAFSLHRTIAPGKISMLEMPRIAREEFGIGAVELVNWMLESDEPDYIKTFMKNAENHGVETLLIMVDRAGSVGATSERARATAVERHGHWLDIAATMGCHSIRMNWAGARSNTMADPNELQDFIQRSVEPLRAISDKAAGLGLNVIVENHGGPSSHPDALVAVIKAVGRENFGTLPDFGNFPPRVDPNGGPANVDKYDAVDKMMPYAKAVSAKCYDFDPETGDETTLDFDRFIEIVVDKHGYGGYIGIEYEGRQMSESDGIKACKALLERLKA